MAWKTLVGCLAIGTMLSGCLTPGDDGGLIRIDAPNGPGGTVRYINGNGVEIAGPTGPIKTINAEGEYTLSGGSTLSGASVVTAPTKMTANSMARMLEE